jgi:thiol-disulfide isomerase/thioredoxin
MVKACTSEDALVAELSSAGGKLVVVDFWATWCGPCMGFAPTFDAMAAEYQGRDEPVIFLKVEDKAADCHQARGIRALPTFQLYLKGSKVAEVSGRALAECILRSVQSFLLKLPLTPYPSPRHRRRGSQSTRTYR